jgi:hypothetical protein
VPFISSYAVDYRHLLRSDPLAFRAPDNAVLTWVAQTASSDLSGASLHLTNLSGTVFSSSWAKRSCRALLSSPIKPSPMFWSGAQLKLGRLIIGPPLVRDVARTTPVRIGFHSVSVHSIECAIAPTKLVVASSWSNVRVDDRPQRSCG